MKKMKKIFLELDYFLDSKIGWFFTNGRKIDSWEKRVELKKNLLFLLKNGKTQKK
jgi:hypothetical protein